MAPPLTPETILRAYASGIFPMAESVDDAELFWLDPTQRGVLPLDGFHISRSLARTIRRQGYSVSLNRDFAAVMNACADRPETWINTTIRTLYFDLHQMNHAHSLEIWQDKRLVGGVYGITLGAAFFGESMFSRQTNASKIALAHLVDRLRSCNFRLFDTQFITPHLASLGAIEISRNKYHAQLHKALSHNANIHCTTNFSMGQELVQRNTHKS